MGNTQYWRNWVNTFCTANGAEYHGDSVNDQYVFGPCRHITMNKYMLCVVDGSLRVTMFFRDILMITEDTNKDGKPVMTISAGANITFTV